MTLMLEARGIGLDQKKDILERNNLKPAALLEVLRGWRLEEKSEDGLFVFSTEANDLPKLTLYLAKDFLYLTPTPNRSDERGPVLYSERRVRRVSVAEADPIITMPKRIKIEIADLTYVIFNRGLTVDLHSAKDGAFLGTIPFQ